MITVQFNQAVKLHSIKFVGPKDCAPKTVKTYVNRLSLGFEEAEGVQETETLVLSEKDYEENAVTNLRFVRYQNVNSVVLFVEDNLGNAETTKLTQLIFLGTPIEATKDVNNLKKMDGAPEAK